MFRVQGLGSRSQSDEDSEWPKKTRTVGALSRGPGEVEQGFGGGSILSKRHKSGILTGEGGVLRQEGLGKLGFRVQGNLGEV